MKHKLLKFLTPILLLVGLGISPYAWGDSGFFTDGQWKAGFNNGSDFWKGYNNDGATEDLGIQTSLKLIGCNVQTWGDVKTNLDWWIAFDSEPTTKNDGQNNFWSIYVDWNGNHENYLDNNDYDLIANATHNPGNNEFYMKWTLRNYNKSTGAAKIKFTIPGFSKTTVEQKDFSTAVGGEGQSKTISFTNHYGNALNTGNCKLTGSDISDFSVTGISETGVTVKFQPSTTGTKNATLTITDAHGKKCTISLMGEAKDPLSTGVTLRGTFNSWSTTDNEFRRATAGATTATTTITFANAKQSERFLVYVDGEKYGNSGTILSSTNSAWGFNKDGADCYFNTACAGTYTFTWDITNKKLSVTYPEENHPSSNYVYFLDDNSWGAVSAHLYDTGDGDKITNWPGQPLRTVTIDGNTYYLCAPGAKQQIIFTNNTDSKRVPKSEPADATTGGAKYLNAKTSGKSWSAFEFAVAIDRNGGDADGSAVAKFGANKFKSGNTFVAPTKTGYSAKFTTDQAGNNAFSNGSEGSTFASNTSYTDASGNWNYNKSDGKLYAQWTANNYTVTFDQTGCTASQYTSLTFTYDAALSTIDVNHRPTPPTGYDYLGYSTKDGTNGDWGALLTDGTGHWNAVDGYTAQVGEDIVWKCELTKLYSKIAPQTYSITYKDQGGKTFSGNWGETVHPTTHTYNTATTLVDAPDKTGYTFDGWYTESTCDNKVTELGATAYTANITLYAKWTPTTTTITVDRQDGSATKEIVATYDGDISTVTSLMDADYQRTGYTFNGMRAGTDKNSSQVIIRSNDAWAFQSNAGSGTYTNGANPPVWKYTPNTLTLYTRWDANPYTITFNQYEPTTSGDASKQVTFDASVSKITAPQKTGKIFSGYYTEQDGAGVQIFDAGGNLVANAAGGDPSITYTSDGKWKYADNITLHAYWANPANQVVNFGITDGTTLSNTLGTITATVDGDTIYSGDEVASGKEVVFEYSAAKGTIIKDINGTKLQNWYDGVNTATATSYSITQNKCTLTVSASTVNAYAYALALEYTVATAVLPVGKGSVESNNDFRCGPNLNTTLTAINPEGYDFVNWTADASGKVQFTGNVNASPIDVAVKEANRTVTANFQIHNYAIAYEGLEAGSTHAGNPDTYTIESETIVFAPATSVLGHKFTGWNPASIALGSTGDKTITASYSAVSLAPIASDNIIEGKQATITPNFTAPDGTYHYEYICASIETFNVGANGVATFTAPAAGNHTITANVYEGSDKTGVLLATTNVVITVAEDLSTNWKLVGDNKTGSPFGDNYTYANGKAMTKAPGCSNVNVAYYTLNVTTLGTFEFKVAKGTGNENFYGWGQNDGDYITFNRDASGTEMQVYSGNQHPLKFTPDMVGEYVFKVDYTTNNVVKVTVTYPTTTTYDVDIYYDGVTKTTIEGGAFAKSITANVPQSMRFDHWEVEGETTHVNITDINSQTTTFTASGEGAVIRAKFKVVGVMYLKAGDVFGDAYVNFYSTDGYWSDDKGSGNKGNNCMSKNNHMTKIGRTDIYYLDVSGGIDKWTWEQAFSFVNKSVEHDNFSMCNVVYRSDYNDRLPLYVPRYGWITNYFIECHYYNDGIWMKYNDTYSGYKLWIREKDNEATAQSVMLTALTPGGYEFNTKLHLKSGTTYELKIYNENGEWYGVSNQTITASSCTNWHFWKGNDNCKLTASDEGDYTFTLNLGSGEVIISVEYPLSENDYRIVAKNGSDIVKYGDLIKNAGTATQKDTVSFFNSNYTFYLQQYAGSDTWNEIAGSEVTPPDEAEQGVIDFIVTQDGQGHATLAYKGLYTGNYYIRTDGVDGGWGDYKNNSDNKMENYGSLLDADTDYQYDVYKAKWVLSGKNVKFRVANDYSKAISDEYTSDAIIDNKETLPDGANIRFMWNSQTNQLKRAYLSGSSTITDRYLVLTAQDTKITDTDGNPFNVSGLNANESTMDDKGNWVYQLEVKAQPGAMAKISAQYNSTTQYFKGSADSYAQVIGGTGEDKYLIRITYDFKTNTMVAGWIPSGDTIRGTVELNAELILIRKGQDAATQLTFAEQGKVQQVKKAYGVIEFKKEDMVSKLSTWDTYAYEQCVYYISFPFNVKVSEIFGAGTFGNEWRLQQYNGARRARDGWFSDTPSFWEVMSTTDTLKANTGYVLQLSKSAFNKADSKIWENVKDATYLYFPSQQSIGTLDNETITVTIDSLPCRIDRIFQQDKDKKPEEQRNHKVADSNWNLIGVPLFQSYKYANQLDGGYLYVWNPEGNLFEPQSSLNYTFNSMHAYMVQYAGEMTWIGSAIKHNVLARKAAQTEHNVVSLQMMYNGKAVTHTYVELRDGAEQGFMLNEDMSMMTNSAAANLYSFAGAYDVAANVLPEENQLVPLGVVVNNAGEYTFSTPSQFDGTITLVDKMTNTSIDLQVMDYTVTLPKGTHEGRFFLQLDIERKITTDLEITKQEKGIFKYIDNNNLYIMRNQRIFDATGQTIR